MMKRSTVLILILALIPIAFIYGFFSAQFELFPYRGLMSLYSRLFFLSRDNQPQTGRWRPAREKPGGENTTEEQEESISRLSALPYLQGSRMASDERNVTRFDSASVYDGLNLFNSGHQPAAFLMDMRGVILHEWSGRFEDLLDGPFEGVEPEEHKTFWRRVHLFENGDMLVMFSGYGLAKIDRNSNPIWTFTGRVHHDLFPAPDGRIFTLTRKDLLDHPQLDLDGPILEDFIAILDSEGHVLKTLSVLDAFLNSPYASALAFLAKEGDVFHTNSIHLLTEEEQRWIPVFKTGHLLISLREINTIAVVNLETEQVTWAMSGMWIRQHDPVPLPNDHLMLFDNEGCMGHSKVIEFDVPTQRIVWQYTGNDSETFYSATCGTNQRLPNGNTLITESDNGRAFEVTRDNRIVWEYKSPFRTGENGELVATLFEMERLEQGQLAGQLDREHAHFVFEE